MVSRMKQVFTDSRIISFLKDLNGNIILSFHDSATYKLFIRLNHFYRDIILKNADDSLIIKAVKTVSAYARLRDIGLFIILVVLFNTTAMLISKRVIDAFSALARVLFLFFGCVIIWKKRR